MVGGGNGRSRVESAKEEERERQNGCVKEGGRVR